MFIYTIKTTFEYSIIIVNGLRYQQNLSLQQWKLINSIIKHPTTPLPIKYKISNIIYTKYETWAIHKAYLFKRFHRHKCRNINIQDLILYSLEGLKKASINYNGKFSFHTYANIYISGQLYKGLTDLQPITNIPKSIRKNKSSVIKTVNNYQYKKCLNTLFVSISDYWMFEKRQNNNPCLTLNNNKEIWTILLENIDPFSKKIVEYKFDYFFNKINSNKRIAELMCCSEETVRQSLKKLLLSKKILLENNIHLYQYNQNDE